MVGLFELVHKSQVVLYREREGGRGGEEEREELYYTEVLNIHTNIIQQEREGGYQHFSQSDKERERQHV